MDTFEDDPCCSKLLAKALLAAAEPLESWTCPRCGCLWTPRQVGPLRNWTPQPAVMVF
jgi:hypothetical protein